MQEILEYLKLSGERLDSEIATGTGIPLAKVRVSVSDMSARGALVTCRVTRFHDGKKIDGILYRVAGYMPPAAPGRKSKAHTRARIAAEGQNGEVIPAGRS